MITISFDQNNPTKTDLKYLKLIYECVLTDTEAPQEAPSMTNEMLQGSLDFPDPEGPGYVIESIGPYRTRKHKKGPSSKGLIAVADLAKHYRIGITEFKDLLKSNSIQFCKADNFNPKSGYYVKAEQKDTIHELVIKKLKSVNS